MVYTGPFLYKLGQKIAIFRGFARFFFRTTGLLKLLIEFPDIFHWKSVKQLGVVLGAKCGPNEVQNYEKSRETGIINRFFHILHGEYTSKHTVMVVQTSEWKFKANIARNLTFEES